MRISTILQMRLQGCTLQQIGDAMDPAVSAVAIHKTLKKALAEMLVEPFEAIRTLELVRLDELMVPIYERAIGGDVSAVDAVLSIQVRRARLLGLDVQPVRFGSASDGYNEGPKVRIEIVADKERANADSDEAARL